MNSKVLIALLLFLILLTNCKEDNFYTIVNEATSETTFTIDPTKDTFLRGENGTLIYFPENIFEGESGENITNDDITIELKEYYEIDDIALSDLSTTCNNSLLETAGMISMAASQGDLSLNIKDSQRKIYVHFPRYITNRYKNEKNRLDMMSYDLFYANDLTSPSGNTQWVADTNSIVEQRVKISMTTYSSHGFHNDDDPFKFRISDNSSLDNGKEVFDVDLKSYKFPEIEKEEFLTESGFIEVHFVLDKSGEITNARVEADVSQHAREELLIFMKNLPKFEPYKSGSGSLLAIEGVFHFNSRTVPIYTNDSLYIEAFEKKIKSLVSSDSVINRDELGYYIFAISKLGLINCDRFLEIEDKIDQYIEFPPEDVVKVKMIFKDMNSFLTGALDYKNEGYIFKGVPNNYEVKILIVKEKNGIIYSSILDTQTSDLPIKDIKFEETTLQELKEQLSI